MSSPLVLAVFERAAVSRRRRSAAPRGCLVNMRSMADPGRFDTLVGGSTPCQPSTAPRTHTPMPPGTTTSPTRARCLQASRSRCTPHSHPTASLSPPRDYHFTDKRSLLAGVKARAFLEAARVERPGAPTGAKPRTCPASETPALPRASLQLAIRTSAVAHMIYLASCHHSTHIPTTTR